MLHHNWTMKLTPFPPTQKHMVGLIFLNLISLVQVLKSTWARIIKYIFLKKVFSFIHHFFFFCHKLGNYSDGLLWKFEKMNINILLFSRSVMSDSLWPYGLQQARLPCPSPSAGVWENSMSIESVMISNHLVLCCPLLLLPSIFSSIRVFSNELVLGITWPKY